MESVLEVFGALSLVVLVAVGLIAGWLAGLMAGRKRTRYYILGVLGAVAAPFVVALLGIGILAAGGVLAISVVGLLGAIALLALVRVLTD